MNLSQIKVTGAMESTAGTSVTPTAVIPVSGLPTLDKTIERKAKDIITGSGMAAGEYTVATNVSGNLPLFITAGPGLGKLLKAHLGNETTTQQIGGLIQIMYTGTQASCKMVVTATTITSNIGALGAEIADAGAGIAGFGTAGVVTLSGYTTLGALVTYLKTFTNYKTTLVMGDTASSTTTPGPIAITGLQANDKYVNIFFKSTTSGVYVHQLQPDLSTTERPSMSIQTDNIGDNIIRAGCYVNEFAMTGATKANVTGSATIIGMSETIGQTASTLVMPASNALAYQTGAFVWDGNSYAGIRALDFKSTNNDFADGYGQGSFDRAYVSKGPFAVSGTFTARLDSNVYTERAKGQSNVTTPVMSYFSGGSLGNFLTEAMIVEMPYISVDKWEWAANSNQLEAKVSYNSYQPTGSYNYDSPLTISIIDTTATAY